MILVGNQRGGGRDLAGHLMKTENERVEVAELRGFVADDLDGAFQESYAISRGTKCKQYLFSLSLNPPKDAAVSDDDFRRAIDQAEAKLGLTGQPRAIVFHEKRGDDGKLRRHAHAVWSRIDISEMKAVQLSHSRRKLQDVSRDLYLEHGWTMPRGLAVTSERDPRNFTLGEWQQAKRIGEDPRRIKAAFQDAWAISDSSAAFRHALEERGYFLAHGDRRGFVAVDHRGEVYAIAKWTGVKTKQVRDKLGDEATLPSVSDAKQDIARAMRAKMEEFQRQVAEKEARQQAEATRKREELKARQQALRVALQKAIHFREQTEKRDRQSRLRTGLRGLWDRLRGERKRTLLRNAQEAEADQLRDLAERDRLIAAQLAQRREILDHRQLEREGNATMIRSLREDATVFRKMETDAQRERQTKTREEFREKRSRPRRTNRPRGSTLEP